MLEALLTSAPGGVTSVDFVAPWSPSTLPTLPAWSATIKAPPAVQFTMSILLAARDAIYRMSHDAVNHYIFPAPRRGMSQRARRARTVFFRSVRVELRDGCSPFVFYVLASEAEQLKYIAGPQ